MELSLQDRDEFVILASDGLWNVMTSQQVRCSSSGMKYTFVSVCVSVRPHFTSCTHIHVILFATGTAIDTRWLIVTDAPLVHVSALRL